MARFFFLVSGEHPTLPFSEITSILEAEGRHFKTLERLRQIFRLEAEEDIVEAIIARAALTKMCCKELFNCAPRFEEIAEMLRRTSLKGTIEKGESYAVRVRRIGGIEADVTSVYLERKLGAIIRKKTLGTKVNLKTPKHVFFGVITENRFMFGLKLAEMATKPFLERRPRKRPFFQPSAVTAKLARCMVNLSKVKKNSLVFDPFCGTGSFLIEAGLMGCRVIGADAQKHMVKGASRNLDHFKVSPEAMIIADAEHPAVTKVDGIVTDPPYGRTASTLGKNTEQIVKAVLPEFKALVATKSRVCIASPKMIAIGKIAERVGFKLIESHYVYVHRSLTREIAILEKP